MVDPDRFATSTRLPTPADFAEMRTAYEAVAPDPGHFEAFMAKVGAAVHGHDGWTPEQIGSITSPALLVVGDHDFVKLDHAIEVFHQLPHARLAVLPDATHMDVLRRVDQLLPMVLAFLDGEAGR